MEVMRVRDHTGARYGRLTAVRPTDQRDNKGQVIWECACECGSMIRIAGAQLGNRTSCGCARGGSTHGLSKHPLYTVWCQIRYRINNPNAPAYRLYGGRGISYSPRWDDFKLFLSDVGERPDNPEGWTSRKPYWTLDRIDPDGNYEPGNVRWATPSEQTRNRSRVGA